MEIDPRNIPLTPDQMIEVELLTAELISYVNPHHLEWWEAEETLTTMEREIGLK
jgi:hypothetical protein